MNDKQAQGLDISKAGMIQGLHDRADSLGRKMLRSSSSTSPVSPISTNHHRGMARDMLANVHDRNCITSACKIAVGEVRLGKIAV